MTAPECLAMCWIEEWGADAYCTLLAGHEGAHDDGAGWEW